MLPMRLEKTAVRGMALASAMAFSVQAQLKWEGCADLAASQLKKTLLVSRSSSGSVAGTTAIDANLKEPVKLAVAKNGDVFIAERGGNIKRWRAGAVATIGTLSVFTDGRLPHPTQGSNENGLHGIVLDPGFETNKWIYVDYAPLSASTIRISRFTVNGDALDPGSEKTLLDIPVQRNSCCHTGGGMEFDLSGNLFVTVGNNTTNPGANASDAYVKESEKDADDQGHAANTNDLRGKILRIKPKADGTYEVPEGNLFAKGTAKTKPEIWAMGLRNPYSLMVDKYRGWVGWGDVGPDDGLSYSEEWNVLTKPGNAGWPYFVGPNNAWRPALGKVASAPMNNSPNNTGLNALPPAVPSTIGYSQSCAVTGPMYYYNGANASKTKMPPHLNKKWLVTDWWKGNLEVVTLSENGTSVVSRQLLMQQNTFNGPLDIQVGPDGALYVAEYGQVSGGLWFAATGNTAISRLEYNGGCHPATPIPEVVAVSDRPGAGRGALVSDLSLGFRRDVRLPDGVKGFRLYDIQGRLVWEYKVNGLEAERVSIPDHVRSGSILRVKFMR